MDSTSDDNNFLSLNVILQALEKSLLIFGAFLFYILNVYLKYDITTYHPILKKYYWIIALFLHLLFIFLLDLFLIYSFHVIFGIKI